MNVLVCCDDFLFFFVHNTRRFRPWWSLLCYLAQSGLRVVVCAVVLRGEEKKKLSQDQGALICETLTGSIIASHCPRESGAYCAKQESLQCDWCGLKSLHWDYGDHVRPVGRFLHHSCRLSAASASCPIWRRRWLFGLFTSPSLTLTWLQSYVCQ